MAFRYDDNDYDKNVNDENDGKEIVEAWYMEKTLQKTNFAPMMTCWFAPCNVLQKFISPFDDSLIRSKITIGAMHRKELHYNTFLMGKWI